jgi:hypothetical protein
MVKCVIPEGLANSTCIPVIPSRCDKRWTKHNDGRVQLLRSNHVHMRQSCSRLM